MRVFLDTNIIISPTMGRGLARDVLRLVMEKHEPVTGEVVLNELRRVLAEKFDVSREDIDYLLESFARWHIEPQPETLPLLRIRDRTDLPVLASALACGADVLLTGDKDLLEVDSEVGEIKITDPRGFWNLHHDM